MRPASVSLSDYCELPPEEMAAHAASFYDKMRRRRSVRAFSDRSVPRGVIEDCLCTAGTAPSGANMQPWHFVVVCDPEVKRRIREAAEERERAFYAGGASQEWLEALAPLETGPDKSFLEEAPCLIVVFARPYSLASDGGKIQHYYVSRSVGLATGLLIAAIHNAGLASLPYTPSPMGFLRELLGRPANERPYLVLVVGYPASDARVPALDKKPLSEIATFV